MEARLLEAGYQLISISSTHTEHLSEESSNIKPDLVLLNYALSDLPQLNEAIEQIRRRLQIPVLNVNSTVGYESPDMVEEAALSVYGANALTGESLLALVQNKLAAGRMHTEHSHPSSLHLSYRRRERVPGFICVRSSHRLTSVKFEEILYVEAMKDYVLIYTDCMVHTSHISMKEILRILPDADFVRIHRSFIVRLDKITSIKYPELVIGGKIRTLPIGGYYRKNLYDQLLII
jgi:hypothetical protein